MEKKNSKPTNAQLLRRIQKSPLHLDFTKNTVSVYFSDKGLRLTVDDTEGYALIATGYHTHCFQSWTSNGISRPYLYTKRVIEIANDNIDAAKTDNGYSFAKMLDALKAKEDKSEYNICVYYEWWCRIIFDGLYSISEDEIGSWLVYFKFVGIIATNNIILAEHKEDMTNKQFVDEFVKMVKELTDGADERVLFHAMTDEERARKEIEALQEQEAEDAMEAQADDSQG